MIRRGFWLAAGAMAGVYGYRRACATARRISDRLTPSASLAPASGRSSGAGRSPGAGRRRGAVGVAAETVRFARDVRDGMELYRLTHSAPAGSTLGTRETNQDPRPKEGR